MPTLNVDVVNVAFPEALRLTTAPLPPSILNVTDPVGVPPSAAETIAVNVTDSPGNELLSDVESIVVVAAATAATETAALNSDVSMGNSSTSSRVAVAVKNVPLGVACMKLIVAIPSVPVITSFDPRNVCPSPLPLGSAAEL